MAFRRRRLPALAAGLLFVALLAGAAFVLRQRRADLASAPQADRPLQAVETVIARAGSVREGQSYLGRVEAEKTVILASRLLSTVTERAVDEGDAVGEGDLLIVLDDREIVHRLAAAEAEKARLTAERRRLEAQSRGAAAMKSHWSREAERFEALAEEEAVSVSRAEEVRSRAESLAADHEASRAALDAVDAALKALDAERKTLTVQQSYSRVRAPFAGRILTVAVEAGETVAAGRELIRMESGGARKVLFDVPREEGSAVTLGHSVVVDGPSGPVEGTVSLVRPAVDSRQRVTVEALLDGGEALLSGAVVPLRLEGPKRAGVVIPREALIESDGGQGVYAVREGTLLFLPVRSVAGDGRSLVVDGLNGGEHVVVRPYLGWSRLSPGQAVREIP